MGRLIEKFKPLFFELVRFGIVGVIATVVDFAVYLLVLRVGFGGAETTFNVAFSNTVGFLLSVTVNYILSVVFVFKAAKKGAGKDGKSVVIFFITAAVGWLLNTLIVSQLVVRFGFADWAAKVPATVIVMVWNYLSRKLLIFK